MAGVESHSEFEGGGVMPNSVFPKGTKALTSNDRDRLDKITGQTEDSRAPVDPWHWQGGTYDPNYDREMKREAEERRRKEQQLRRESQQRYRETQY